MYVWNKSKDGNIRNFSKEHQEACDYLINADTELAKTIAIIQNSDDKIIWQESGTNYFAIIVKSIISQLLSIHAAKAIFDRLNIKVSKQINSESILSISDVEWREIGMSKSKTKTIQLLAKSISENKLSLKDLVLKPSQEIYNTLIDFKGIGPWTAQMFLIFQVRDINILPTLDSGIWQGAKITYNLNEYPDADWFKNKKKIWNPFCSIVSLYLWKILHLKKKELKRAK